MCPDRAISMGAVLGGVGVSAVSEWVQVPWPARLPCGHGGEVFVGAAVGQPSPPDVGIDVARRKLQACPPLGHEQRPVVTAVEIAGRQPGGAGAPGDGVRAAPLRRTFARRCGRSRSPTSEANTFTARAADSTAVSDVFPMSILASPQRIASATSARDTHSSSPRKTTPRTVPDVRSFVRANELGPPNPDDSITGSKAAQPTDRTNHPVPPSRPRRHPSTNDRQPRRSAANFDKPCHPTHSLRPTARNSAPPDPVRA